MEDSISQDDRLIDTEAKTKLELELERERKTTSLIEERLRAQEKKLAEVTTQFEQINVFMNQLTTQDPSLIKLLTQKAKAHRIQL
jgi:Asp-tRNA(Asn)/Glu-tRNA(Gln) amidotransferase C subunit